MWRFINFYYGWIIVASAISLGFLTTGLSGYANGILLPKLADEIADGSRGQISIAFSIATFTAAIFAPLIGRVADERSPRTILFCGACLLSVGYIGLGFATEVWHVWFTKGFLFGIGMTMAGPLVRNLLVAHWFDRWRGRALGFSVIGASLAGVALPLLMTQLVNELGWRNTVFVFAFAVSAMLLPVIYFLLRDRPEDIGEVKDGRKNVEKLQSENHAKVTSGSEDEPLTWLNILRLPSFWAAGLIFGPMTCAYIVMMVHLFGHALESGLSETQAALILSTMAFCSVIGKPAMGTIADYVGIRPTIWASLLLQGVALTLFTISSELWHFLIAAALQGAGYSALSPMRTYTLSVTLGMRSLGSSLGLLKWLELPFAIIASPAAGFVYDASGSYDLAFLTFAGMMFFACLGPFFIRRRAPAKSMSPSTA